MKGGRAAVASSVLMLLLAGCATHGPERAAPAATADQAASAASLAPALEASQRAQAEQALAQGRWQDARWAAEVVLAIAPGDAAMLALRDAALAGARQTVEREWARGQQAQRAGQWDTATRAMLAVLGAEPTHAGAADALRAMEKARTRGGSHPGPRATTGESMASAARRSADVSNEMEYANLLAAQGDLSAAVATLEPLARKPGAEPALRGQLAHLYWLQAQKALERGDSAAARAALQACLRLSPRHRPAAEQLGMLNRQRAAGPSAAGQQANTRATQ